MAFKMRETSSNLFTLNQSLKLGDHLKSDQSSILDEPTDNNFVNTDLDIHKEQIQKLNEEIEALKKQNYQIKLKNKELKDALQIAELHNKKHEQKQRELIKKLSHQQISNKQLQFEIKKANQEVMRIRESARNSDSKNIQASYSIKKSQEERLIFIQSFRKIAEAISKCEKIDDFQICVSKFLDFLKKNIKNYESTETNGQFQFDLKFQLGQISSLKSKGTQLQSKVLKLKDELQRQRLQKKKQQTSFNEKLLKLKDQCDGLKSRLIQISNQMNERRNEAQIEINTLKKALTQKNEIISELKYKIDSEKKAKQSVCSKKSRVRKRSFYISDGQRQQGSRPFSDIENQIEYLEREISQVMQDIKQ